MAEEEKNLDIRKAIEQGATRTSLRDLQQKGFENVRVLDQKAVTEMITQAVDRVVTTQTDEEKSRLLAESRRELDRLLKEHKAARSRAQLLEADKNELIEQVESLQRELELKSEIEEAELHRKYEEGTASLQKQVEDLRAQLVAERETSARGAEAGKRLQQLQAAHETALREIQQLQVQGSRMREEAAGIEKAMAEEQARVRGAEQARTDLVAQVLELQGRGESAKQELAGFRGDVVRQRSELTRLGQELEEARGKLAGAEKDLKEVAQGSEMEIRGLRARAQELEGRLAAGEEALRKSAALEKEIDALRQEATRTAADLARRDLDGAAQRKKAEADEEEFRREIQKRAEEIEQLREELDSAKNEAAFLGGQLAQQEKDHEIQKGKTVIVTAELEEIEARQQREKEEFDALRAETIRLQQEHARILEDHAAAAQELAGARGELQGLQEVLSREQEAARGAQNEAARLQTKLQEVLERSGALDGRLAQLDAENKRLQGLIATAEAGASSAQARQEHLDRLAGVLELALRNSTAARSAALHSKDVGRMLQETLERRQNPKKPEKRGADLRKGVAYDGLALLRAFFKKIGLKERFQKHVPIQERAGEDHPSEMLVRVVEGLLSGDRPAGRKDKGLKLEILGPSRGPDLAALRLFLGRVGPHAIHRISRVHDALRLHLVSLPEKPARLGFDVGTVETTGRSSYAPLVCFEAQGGEFWNGLLRGAREASPRGIVPFLKECVNKVPPQFGRSRLRFRMTSDYFSEDAVRFLNRKGCSYVLQAPDLKEYRDTARQCRWRELSGGWEAGEFSRRIHPIRKTEGRFVVLRRRLSRKDVPGAPILFRDPTHAYCVFAVDKRLSPWRAYEFFAARPAAMESARGLLGGFAKSRLLGRRRRSHAALFQLYLLASDLVQWFKRRGLPVEERARDLESLRSDLLMLPPMEERTGATGLLVLPRKDGHRKSFERVTRKIRRLRPVRPFRFRGK